MAVIENGNGNSTKAKVNENFRLYTNSVSVNETEQATKKGRSFNVNTGFITLTNATDTPVLYLKNNGDDAIHITALAVGLFTSAGGTAEPYITIIRNPKTGTIISNANDVDINSNRNYGSEESLTVNAYKGATGETMTDGTDHLLLLQTEPSRLFANIDELIPKGTSIGIKIQPGAGNTSMKLYAALICHLEDPKE